MATILKMFIGIMLVISAFVGWAVYMPASHSFLDRVGILEPMRGLGIPVAEAANGAAERGGPGGPPGGGAGAVAVTAHHYAETTLDDRLNAIGTGQAVRAATLTPEASGRLTQLAVTSGDYVDEGALIARLDREAEQIAVDRARILLEDAQATAERFARLQSSGSATDVQIRESQLAVRNAELSLREAEFNLERRDVRAPFAGWIGIVGVEIGNQVSNSTEITRIDDRSVLLVDFNVPERFVGLISQGDTMQVTPLARPEEQTEGRIRAIDSRVDQASRTLRIQGEIPNTEDRLRAGMAFTISLSLQGQAYPIVDPLAIQWGRDGAFVWAADVDGIAREVPVEIIQRRDRLVLVSGELSPDDRVIVEGIQNLRPNAQVDIAELRALLGTGGSAPVQADETADIHDDPDAGSEI